MGDMGSLGINGDFAVADAASLWGAVDSRQPSVCHAAVNAIHCNRANWRLEIGDFKHPPRSRERDSLQPHRKAGFQSAGRPSAMSAKTHRTVCRLEVGDTADWKSALRVKGIRGWRRGAVWAGAWLALQLACGSLGAARPELSLTGVWDFYPGVGDAGLEGVKGKAGKITVPGAWQAQGYGEPGGSIPSSVVGADVTPAEYLRHNLTARCLYAREIEVPPGWGGRRVFLCARRVYRYADVTVNGTRIGEYEGFSSPFEFDVTEAICFGGSNEIVIGVDNRPRAGRDTVGMANYFSNAGGFGGAVYLEARAENWIQEVFAMPRLEAAEVRLRVTLKRAGGAWPEGMTVTAEVRPWDAAGQLTVPAGKGERRLPAGGAREFTMELPVTLAPLRLWSPEEPFLYVAAVRLAEDGKAVDEREARFGMREITARANKLFLNGKPLFLAGYGDDTTYPLTGMMPWDKGVYLRQLRLMRGLGFNFVRHHSCIPHDEYFEAADEAGMLVQPEASMAYVKFWPKAHELFATEWPNIITAFRNHPSIWAWCMGNELFLEQLPERATNTGQGARQAGREREAGWKPAPRGRDRFTRQDALEIIERAYHQAKELDPTRLVHVSDGGTPQKWTDVVSSGKGEKFGPKPYLLHEYGNYTCSLPDFSLIPRLDGVIRPLTYERARAYVKRHELEAVYPRLYRSALAMRADAQKQYLEAARGSEANAGYSFWLGIDFPESPEGCWDEGILNELWEPKPGLTNGLPELTGPTVLLTSVGPESRSFYNDEPRVVELRLSHYGSQAIESARVLWRVRQGEKGLKEGELAAVSCGLGQVKTLGEVSIPALASEVPRFLTLECELREGTQYITKNSWEFFAYPRIRRPGPLAGVFSEAGPIPGATELKPQEALPAGLRLLITRGLKRERHGELLRAGRAAVLLLGTGGFAEKRAGYFLNAAGGAFGGIIEEHPVFASIPHQGRLHQGLYQLIAGGGMLEAEAMPAALREGAVVWGLGLTGWISREKNLQRWVHYSDVMTERGLHLVLCDLDLLADRPESRYVLAKTLDYLAAGTPSRLTARCATGELERLLR